MHKASTDCFGLFVSQSDVYTWLHGVGLSCKCFDCVPSEESRGMWGAMSLLCHTLLMWWAVLIALPWHVYILATSEI